MGIAVLVILANNPYCILDIGFQLSFGGTLGIILFQNMIKGKKFKRIFIILLAQIFIFPISIMTFSLSYFGHFIFLFILLKDAMEKSTKKHAFLKYLYNISFTFFNNSIIFLTYFIYNFVLILSFSNT